MRRQRSRDKIEQVERLRAEARLCGGEEAIEAQHQKGKLTARERLDLFFDQGTFQELDLFVRTGDLHFGEKRSYLTDGVITGFGSVNGRPVYVFAQDFTIMGGSLGERHAQKIVKLLQMAVRNGLPIIGLNDSGGARIQEGVQSLAGYADIFYWNSVASGVVPQIAAIMGPCAGGAVYSPALMDFVVMVKATSYMFLTGPQVIKTVLHQDVTAEEVGGARVHNQISGVAHFMAADDEDALETIKKLLSYLPSHNLEDPPFVPTDDPPDRREDRLDDLIPDDPNKPYDVHD
ncbi:MAG: acyl-CoA carboxylase subunit beta, partial [bacterium JZ-2024 1]